LLLPQSFNLQIKPTKSCHILVETEHHSPPKKERGGVYCTKILQLEKFPKRDPRAPPPKSYLDYTSCKRIFSLACHTTPDPRSASGYDLLLLSVLSNFSTRHKYDTLSHFPHLVHHDTCAPFSLPIAHIGAGRLEGFVGRRPD